MKLYISILLIAINLTGCISTNQPTEKKGLVMQLPNSRLDSKKNVDVSVFNFTVEEKK